MVQLTSRQRLDRLYRRQETDRPGVYVRRGWPGKDPGYAALIDYVNANTDVKLGAASEYFAVHWYQREGRDEPYSDEYMRRVCTVTTPMGELSSSFFKPLKGAASLHERYLINDRRQAEMYLSLPMPPSEVGMPNMDALNQKLGDRGIVEFCIDGNAASRVAEMLGSENLAVMSITDRDMIHALLEREQAILMNGLERVLANGIGPYFAILGQEYIVPPLHGRDDFYDFCVRYDKPLIARIHEAGGLVHVHSHGAVGKVLDGFIEMGADVLHPIEPPPMGDVTAAQAKARLRGKVCIEGNIQIADIYEATPQAMAEQTRRLIADAFDDRCGLIVCPTASPYIVGSGEKALENIKAMTEAVLAYAG